MIIERVNIPKDFNGEGLCEINMSRLGSVVIIAGKNGSGKTRLLNHIYFCVNQRPTDEVIPTINKDIINHENALKDEPDSPHAQNWEYTLNELKKQICTLGYLSFSETLPKYKAISFVPQDGHLIDSDTLSKDAVITSHDSCRSGQIEGFKDSVFSYIQTEQNRWFSATHQNSTLSQSEKDECINSYENLKELINKFLGIGLGRDKDDSCTIFGLKLGNSKLSAGQKILLQLCVAIHAQGATLNNLILILDEPENHLHPAAQFEFINTVISSVKNGQIWISTHSVHILAALNTSDIWYMYDGGVKYSGKEPEKVLKGLLGDETQVEKLRDFIDLPAQLAANTFAYECLFSPTASITQKDDKQTTQIRDIIIRIKAEKGKVRVLDYGAGKGRLISAIYDNEENKQDIVNWLDYIAFDKYDTDQKECRDAISRVYGDNNRRYYNKESDIIGDYDKGTYDLIIMCNVLHEISPKHWTEIFTINSMMGSLLSDNGYLLIVEDLHIPNGEKPNEDGFFILGKAEIKTLFCIPETELNFITQSSDNKDRLFAYLIPKKYMNEITTTSRQDSLQQLKSRAKEEITCLRKNTDYKSGKLLGLWTQQLANLALYLE